MPVIASAVVEAPVKVAFVAKRKVLVALVLVKYVMVLLVDAKFVVVAFVPVAEVKVKYGKVLEVLVVALKNAATTSPTTESFAYGLEVAMPTLPFAVMRKRELVAQVDAVVVATSKRGV